MRSISLIQALVLIDQGISSVKPMRSKNPKIDYFEVTEESLALAQKLAEQILSRNPVVPGIKSNEEIRKA